MQSTAIKVAQAGLLGPLFRFSLETVRGLLTNRLAYTLACDKSGPGQRHTER